MTAPELDEEFHRPSCSMRPNSYIPTVLEKR
jgi:hypothetical protein